MKKLFITLLFSCVMCLVGFAQPGPGVPEIRVLEKTAINGPCAEVSDCANDIGCYVVQMRVASPGFSLSSYNVWFKYEWSPFFEPNVANYGSDNACLIPYFQDVNIPIDNQLAHMFRITGANGGQSFPITPDVWTTFHEVCLDFQDLNGDGRPWDEVVNEDICAAGPGWDGSNSTITFTDVIVGTNSVNYTNMVQTCLTQTVGTFTCLLSQGLPIELLYFDGIKIENKVRLDWKTETEVNNDYFNVQRSVDGLNFASIGRVQGAGTTTEPQAYQLWDESLPVNEFIYYRLKQVDLNGTFTYSDVVVIDNRKLLNQDVFDISPNPTDDVAYISYDFSDAEDIELSLYTTSGQLLSRSFDESISHTQNNSMALDVRAYPMGMYLVELIVDGKQMVQKLNISR